MELKKNKLKMSACIFHTYRNYNHTQYIMYKMRYIYTIYPCWLFQCYRSICSCMYVGQHAKNFVFIMQPLKNRTIEKKLLPRTCIVSKSYTLTDLKIYPLHLNNTHKPTYTLLQFRYLKLPYHSHVRLKKVPKNKDIST